MTRKNHKPNNDNEIILCIESATDSCSVALCSRREVISIMESRDEKSHSRLLAPYVDRILRDAGIKVTDLSAIAVSKGPGSYTGLRIGVSLAKGLAYGASLPLIGIDTLLSLYYNLLNRRLTGHLKKRADELYFCPMIDARRMEVYYSLIGPGGIIVTDTTAAVVDEVKIDEIIGEKTVIFFGDGASKCRGLTNNQGALFIDDLHPSAAGMRIPAFLRFDEKNYEDIAYFEPHYLKEFQATTPKKKMP